MRLGFLCVNAKSFSFFCLQNFLESPVGVGGRHRLPVAHKWCKEEKSVEALRVRGSAEPISTNLSTLVLKTSRARNNFPQFRHIACTRGFDPCKIKVLQYKSRVPS
jgi:hypothetical protein